MTCNVTPSQLNAAIAAMTPAQLAAYVASLPSATDAQRGLVSLSVAANYSQATNDTEAVTPAHLAAALAALPGAVSVPTATDTVAGISALAVAANYPSASNTEATTPAYVAAAIAAMPAGATAASNVSVLDAGNALVSSNVEGALQEIALYPQRGTLWDKLKEIIHIKDSGAPDTGAVDVSAIEASALSTVTSLRGILGGLWMWKFPRRGLKVWKQTFGIKDNAAVVSISLGDETAEPVTQVVGFATHADVAGYVDRDHVGLFVQAIAPPVLVDTVTTTFTATTVTSAAFAAPILAGKVKLGMMVDTGETPKKTGTITGFTDTTLTVSAWYVQGGAGATGTPPNGSRALVNPATKVWATNLNVQLDPGSHASGGVGCEAGLFNYKAPDLGYLYDAVNLGTYRGAGAFQCRGSWITGFYAYAGCQFGYVSQAATTHAFYAQGAHPNSFFSEGATNAVVLSKGVTGQALLVQDASGANLAYIDGNGRNCRTRGRITYYTAGQTIDDFSFYCAVAPVTVATTVNLPAPGGTNAERMLYLHNALASTASVTWAGIVESGSGSVVLAPGATRMLISDNTAWVG